MAEDYKAKYERLKERHLKLKLAIGEVLHHDFQLFGHHGGRFRPGITDGTKANENLRILLCGSTDWQELAEYYGWEVERPRKPR